MQLAILIGITFVVDILKTEYDGNSSWTDLVIWFGNIFRLACLNHTRYTATPTLQPCGFI